MLIVDIQIHRNILSAQCYARYVYDSYFVNAIKIRVLSSKLELSLLLNGEIVKKVNIITPSNLFLPVPVSSNSSDPIDECLRISTSAGQPALEYKIRLPISSDNNLDQSESEIKVNLKDFYKERFKNGGHWDLFCASCGVPVPGGHIVIDGAQEYPESELSEGWFCHGKGPQAALKPSSRILYFDDASIYLYPSPDLNSSCQNTTAPNGKCSISHDDDHKKCDCVSGINTDCSNVSCPGSSDISRSCDSWLIGSKVLNAARECKSCGDNLSPEKSSIPFIRYYSDKLMFKNSSFDDDYLEYAHKIIMLSFWNMVRKSQTSPLPSKLFLQSKVGDEDLCLLLWIPITTISQFVLRESLENIPQEVDLRMESVYKVLYFVGTSRSENVRSWRHNFRVDFYHVSDTMVKTLIAILEDSSSHFPETTADGGFSSGFLQAPS